MLSGCVYVFIAPENLMLMLNLTRKNNCWVLQRRNITAELLKLVFTRLRCPIPSAIETWDLYILKILVLAHII